MDINEEPIKGAEVNLYRIGDELLHRFAKTDDGGFFSIRNLPPDNYKFTISLEGYIDAEVKFIRIPAGVSAELIRLTMIEERAGVTGGSTGGNILYVPR